MNQTTLKKAELYRSQLQKIADERTNLYDASRMVGLSRATILKYTELLSIQPCPMSEHPLRQEIKELCENTNLNTRQIASQLHIPRPVVREIMVIMGVSPSSIPTGPTKKMALRDQQIVQMRSEGMKYEEIGKKFGMTRERVRQIIVRDAQHLTGIVEGASKKVCTVCLKIHENSGPTCSKECAKRLKSDKRKWTRDVMEAIMRLRDEGLTWAEVGEQVGLPYVRERIQVYRHLLSFEEQQKYIPCFEAWMLSEFKFRGGKVFSSRDPVEEEGGEKRYVNTRSMPDAVDFYLIRDGAVYLVLKSGGEVKTDMDARLFRANPNIQEAEHETTSS